MNVLTLKPFGAEITNIDLSKPRSDQECAQLLELFNEHYLLIFRRQSLSDDDHRRIFHDLFPGESLGDETGTGSDISYVSNVRADGQFGETPLTFHSDFSFTTQPTRIISLYGFEVNDGAASTEFSNGELALANLPPDLRAYLQGKAVICATNLMSNVAHIPSYNLPGREDLSGRSHEEIVRAAWPVIMDHPRSGRPLIYVNEQHAHHLHGVPLAEGREVLERLCGYLYADDQIYSHTWQQGDFLLWDNIALSHGRRATAGTSARRTLRRVRSGGATLPEMVSLSQRGIEAPESDDDRKHFEELQIVRRTLGDRIMSYRLARDWTQIDLSKACGIRYERIGMFEVGNWIPSIPDLCALAGALEIDPGQFIAGLSLKVASAES